MAVPGALLLPLRPCAMKRLALSAMLLLLPALTVAQAPKNPMGGGKQMPGPAKMDAATVAAWHAGMKKWRDEYRASVKYNGTAVYSDPQLTWTQTSYMQPQMHPCEHSIHRTSSDAPRARPPLSPRPGHLHLHEAAPWRARVWRARVQMIATSMIRSSTSTPYRPGSTTSTRVTVGSTPF
jgi:hypothetical protein